MCEPRSPDIIPRQVSGPCFDQRRLFHRFVQQAGLVTGNTHAAYPAQHNLRLSHTIMNRKQSVTGLYMIVAVIILYVFADITHKTLHQHRTTEVMLSSIPS